VKLSVGVHTGLFQQFNKKTVSASDTMCSDSCSVIWNSRSLDLPRTLLRYVNSLHFTSLLHVIALEI